VGERHLLEMRGGGKEGRKGSIRLLSDKGDAEKLS